jgi:hypothetical protein
MQILETYLHVYGWKAERSSFLLHMLDFILLPLYCDEFHATIEAFAT